MDINKVLLLSVALVEAIQAAGRRARTDTIDRGSADSRPGRLPGETEPLALQAPPIDSYGEHLKPAANF
jgi:hypothetical protein